MEPLEKLEIIVRGRQNQKKIERGRGKDKHNRLYILGLGHEIDMLSVVLCDIDSIRRNVPSMSDEIVQKMYGA